MGLYVNAHGRAINTRGNTLMIAENLPTDLRDPTH